MKRYSIGAAIFAVVFATLAAVLIAPPWSAYRDADAAATPLTTNAWEALGTVADGGAIVSPVIYIPNTCSTIELNADNSCGPCATTRTVYVDYVASDGTILYEASQAIDGGMMAAITIDPRGSSATQPTNGHLIATGLPSRAQFTLGAGGTQPGNIMYRCR